MFISNLANIIFATCFKLDKDWDSILFLDIKSLSLSLSLSPLFIYCGINHTSLPELSLTPPERKSQAQQEPLMEDTEVPSHPLLRTRRTDLNHDFSSSQMEAMAAFCEALIPPVPLFKESPLDQSLLSFYQSSAFQAPIPDEVIFLLLIPFKLLFFLVLRTCLFVCSYGFLGS